MPKALDFLFESVAAKTEVVCHRELLVVRPYPMMKGRFLLSWFGKYHQIF